MTPAMLVAEPTDRTAEVMVDCYVGAEWVAGDMFDPELCWVVTASAAALPQIAA